jgi:hypothetical protein
MSSGRWARGSDPVDSDLDLLVEFDEDATLLDLSALELAYGELVHGPAQTEGWIELQLHIAGAMIVTVRPPACLGCTTEGLGCHGLVGPAVRRGFGRRQGEDAVRSVLDDQPASAIGANLQQAQVRHFRRNVGGESQTGPRRGVARRAVRGGGGHARAAPTPDPGSTTPCSCRSQRPARNPKRSAREPSARTGAALRTAAGRAATTTAMGTTSERARPLLIRPVRPCRRPGVRLSGSCRAHARRLLARTISRVGTTTVAGGDSSPTSRAKICCAASEPLAIGSWWIAVIGGSTSPAYSMSS